MPWIDEMPAEFADSIPEDLRNNETLNQYNSVEDMLRGHVNTKAMVGQSIRVPGEDAGPSDWEEFNEKLLTRVPSLMPKPDLSEPEQAGAFYKSLGTPEKPEDYNSPEGADVGLEVEAQLREVLHKANLTDAQFQTVMGEFATMEAQTTENNTTLFNSGRDGLKSKWGMAVEERMAAAKKMNDEFYPGRDFDGLQAGDIESLYSVYVSVTGTGPQVAVQGEQPSAMTPMEAKDRAAEIMRKIHDPEANLSHEEKMRLIQKRMNLLTEFAGYSDDINDLRVG